MIFVVGGVDASGDHVMSIANVGFGVHCKKQICHAVLILRFFFGNDFEISANATCGSCFVL